MFEVINHYQQLFKQQFKQLNDLLTTLNLVSYTGRIQTANGTIIIASIPMVKIGDLCLIEEHSIGLSLYAEVVAIDQNDVKLLPFGGLENISREATVRRLSESFQIKISNAMLGKVVNGLGEVIGSLDTPSDIVDTSETKSYPVMRLAPDPLKRLLIEEVLVTGVKSIDLYMTCGKGQRLAIFAGPGMGKTTLMGMIMRYAQADIIIIALIGERGREVREFIDLELDQSTKHKCILVVVTSDRPPVEQVKSAFVAQTIAEHFRDQGKDVVMFVDSITRFARAQREVGLSAGEPITRGGFPPSVYLAFPKLMERAGKNEFGSISAFYTVLMEGEATNQDPIADEIKSIVDGHIVLSKKLVEMNHFPAINVLSSLSRVADRLITNEHKDASRHLRMLLSKHEELEFLLRVGEYKRGNDATADESIDKHDKIMKMLKQKVDSHSEYDESIKQMIELSTR
jgi:ATP synthase in type III secretion protein N